MSGVTNINELNPKANTPLIHAVLENNIAEVVRLIAAGADVNKKSGYGYTPIHEAVQNDYVPIVKLLIDAGADVNILSNDGYSPIHSVSSFDIYIMEMLINAGADVNKVTPSGLSALHSASQWGRLNSVKRLIAAGANLNAVSTTGFTPLIVACNSRQKEIAKTLIEAGADVNKANNIGSTALHGASTHKDFTDIVKLLLDKGADVNKANRDGTTALYIASNKGNIENVRMLLAAGANPNILTGDYYDKQTPLHIAVFYEYIDIVKLLLAAGADVNIPNKYGKSPINLAKTMKMENILRGIFPPKWLGWTRGDAAKLDGIFGDDETAGNFALCPVCMKYVIRSDACMYMSHNCTAIKGYCHETLYQKYKNSDGIINWCTICGRICKGHNHYKLGSAQGMKPAIIIGRNPFEYDCMGEGGGGVTEKLLRFRRLREVARQLQTEVGKIDWNEAMDKLCEEMWNAPMKDIGEVLAQMQTTKKFNISNTDFPITLPAAENAPNIPFSGELPVVHSSKTDAYTNAMNMDDTNILQFRHKKADGSWNRHEGPGQQISREAFIVWLKTMLEDPTAESFGKCWQFKTALQKSVLPESEKARLCDAILHPEEVKAALDLTDEYQSRLSEGYRKTFNEMMR